MLEGGEQAEKGERWRPGSSLEMRGNFELSEGTSKGRAWVSQMRGSGEAEVCVSLLSRGRESSS